MSIKDETLSYWGHSNKFWMKERVIKLDLKDIRSVEYKLENSRYGKFVNIRIFH